MDKPTVVTPSPAEILYQQQHIDDNRVATLIAADVVCFTLGCIAVCMRLVSTRIANVKYMADDWFIIGALILTASVMFCELLVIRWGMGKHTIVGTNPAALRKTIIAAEFLYSYAMCLVKASVLFLYHRVFFLSRNFTRGLWAVGLFVFGYSGILAVASTLQCFPLRHIWDSNVGGYCLAIPLAGTILAVFNVLTDIIILVMPMPILWRMQRETKEKLQIMGIFLLGGFVLVCSLVRTAILHEETWTDPNWDDVTMGIWSLAELAIGIVSACLPTIRPLFSKATSRFRRSSNELEHPGPDTRESSDPNLGVTLQQAPSIPAHSKTFSHLGVLGDLEPCAKYEKVSEKT